MLFPSCFTTPPPPPPPIIHEVTSSATPKFQNFPGIMLPDPPRLACPLGHHLSWFIGHLWKRLLRTLIRYWDQTDQETAPWRLHCTVRISFLDRIINYYYTFIGPLKALNIYIERWICVWRNWGGENHKIYQKIYEGDYFNKITFKGVSPESPHPCNK